MFRRFPLLLVATGLFAACAEPVEPGPAAVDPACPAGVSLGDCAPDWVLRAGDGNEVSLQELIGDVVVVETSGMWCPACWKLSDGLQELHQAYERCGVTFVNVILEGPEGEPPVPANAVTWSESFEIDYPILIDEDGQFAAVWNPDVRVPLTYIIDREGMIVWREFGSGKKGRIAEALHEHDVAAPGPSDDCHLTATLLDRL